VTTGQADGAAPGPAPAGSPAPAPREAYFDNVRAVLIVLVVIGHAVESVKAPAADALYAFLYAFHMPAFVLVSGYLSRNWEASARQVRGAVEGLAIPYVVFSVIVAAEPALLAGGTFAPRLLAPTGPMWFLLALLVWRLAVPVFRWLRHPLAFAAALALAAPIDAQLDALFSLGRVLAFLPFFVAGTLLTRESFRRLGSRGPRAAGALVLAALAAAALLWHDDVPRSWLRMRGHYPVTAPLLASAGARAAVLAVAALATAAVLAWGAERRRWYTVIGRNSLSVYVLHIAILGALKYLPATAGLLRGEHSTRWTVLVVLGAGALGLALGAPGVERALRWLVRPPIGRFLVEDAAGRESRK
jgi:fucose 4-O-acetylase-like acetyltransferase